MQDGKGRERAEINLGNGKREREALLERRGCPFSSQFSLCGCESTWDCVGVVFCMTSKTAGGGGGI